MNKETRPAAHIDEHQRVHALSEHLLATAGRAEASAARFGNASWGRLAGLWHDLGKFSGDFQ